MTFGHVEHPLFCHGKQKNAGGGELHFGILR
jgi:hypothetical protein